MTSSEELAASDRVRAEWARRIEAEYRSAALTHTLTLWLIQMGASPDLIRDGLRIVDDELVHAEMATDVYGVAGGGAPPRIDRRGLVLPRTPGAALEADVLRYGVKIFCLGETVAVPLFVHLRAGCTQPAAREALDRVVRDEVRHRDFGWTLLDWYLDVPALAALVDQQVAAELDGMFAGLEGSYGARDGDARDLDEDDRAWGLAPSREYEHILRETFEREWQPRFTARGIDPAPAWARRLEVKPS